jgi:hypothetical protein
MWFGVGSGYRSGVPRPERALLDLADRVARQFRLEVDPRRGRRSGGGDDQAGGQPEVI